MYIMVGDLDWVYKGMIVKLAATFGGLEIKQEEIVTLELIDEITQIAKYFILGPIKTKLGYHSSLLCENRDGVVEKKIWLSLNLRLHLLGRIIINK